MPEKSGKNRVPKSSTRKVFPSQGQTGVLRRYKVLSRAKALRKIRQMLDQSNYIPEEVLHLITLFHVHIDELTEAGVPYEMACALERRYPMLLGDLS